MIIEKTKQNTMANLSEKIQSIIDPKDPNQKLIGMLTLLLEERLEKIETKIEGISQKVNKLELTTEKHNTKCPLCVPERVKKIEDDIDWLQTIKKYKYLLILVIAGIFKIIELGYDKIINLL